MITLSERIMHSIGQLFLKLVTRPNVINPQHLLPESSSQSRIYYVLESNRLSHRLLLKKLLQKQCRPLTEQQILIADSKGHAPLRETMIELVNAQISNAELETLIIPVAIFHGRLPHHEKSWLNLLCAETWHRAGPLGSALQLLVNGRQTLIQVDEPLHLKSLISTTADHEDIARKAARILRTHFSLLRQSIIGPDLSHRRTLISLVLNNPAVQQAIDQQAQERGTSRHRIERHCLKTLDSIAANFSPTTARILDPIFNWVWRRLYRHVRIHNVAPVQEIAKTHQLIYLPCHRSHMDYLLLSWALYREGLMIPHVAAGENLNIPLVGPILKRGGAIFMRRSFQGDPLYASLYKAYLEQMSHRGHALEYFIEGGRSRTGRLLPPKTGLLSMSVESFREGSPRPVALIPVWIGYDRLVESKSYLQEMSGARKQGESLSNFFGTLKILKEQFGDTQLSFGKPLLLEEQSDPSRELQEDVKQIANQVMTEINRASGITQTSLLATCLLGGSQLQSVAELGDKCSRLRNLLAALLSDTPLLPEGKPSDWIQQSAAMKQLESRGNLIDLTPEQAEELAFYRNNIQHFLIIPALYLLLVHRLAGASAQTINRTLRSLYPFIRAELFLPCPDDQLTVHLRQIRDVLISHNLLEEDNGQHWRTTPNPLVNTLILTAEPILLRYYIVLRVLDRFEEIGLEDLMDSSRSIADLIHREYGYRSGEYLDRKVLQTFIAQLADQSWLHDNNGRLSCSVNTTAIFEQAEKILRPHLINLIERQLRTS